MKEIKITPPKGYEIDRENSSLDCIKFKPIKKKLDYSDICKLLFHKKPIYFINSDCTICKTSSTASGVLSDANNCTSEKQAKRLLAINKLMNTAKYLNDQYEEKDVHKRWYINLSECNTIVINWTTFIDTVSIVYFKSEELAKQAIDILGEDTIKLALSTKY